MNGPLAEITKEQEASSQYRIDLLPTMILGEGAAFRGL